MKHLKPIIFATYFILSTSSTFSDTQSQTVAVAPLSSLLIESVNSAPANIISLNHPTLSAEITGKALEIYVESGDSVSEGTKLASIDCRSYVLAKKQAQAALKVSTTQQVLAKKQLLRNQRLVKNGTIPRSQFDQTEANLQSSSADLEVKRAVIETSQLSIDRCEITAPFAGQITERLVQKGQLVSPGTPLFKLMQDNKLELSSELSPSDILKLDESTKLEFISGDLRTSATVRSVIKTIDETTRTQEVRLSLSNNKNLPAGLSGRLEWNNNQKKIPTEFIQRRNNDLGIMVVEDIVEDVGKAKFIALKGAIEGQPAFVDLPSNTAVINKNQFRIKDGEQVRLQK